MPGEWRDTCAKVTAHSNAFQVCVYMCRHCLWSLASLKVFWWEEELLPLVSEANFSFCQMISLMLSPATWYIWACGKAYPAGSLFYNLSYDLEWSNSGKNLNCTTECRPRIMLSMNLYICMLGALPCELFSNVFFGHMRGHGLYVKWLTSSFSGRVLLLDAFLCQVSGKEPRKWWWYSVTFVQNLDHLVALKHLLGARSLLCSHKVWKCLYKVCKEVIGRQHSNGKVIAFKYQDTGLKEIK